jgi:hypothetical protein
MLRIARTMNVSASTQKSSALVVKSQLGPSWPSRPSDVPPAIGARFMAKPTLQRSQKHLTSDKELKSAALAYVRCSCSPDGIGHHCATASKRLLGANC